MSNYVLAEIDAEKSIGLPVRIFENCSQGNYVIESRNLQQYVKVEYNKYSEYYDFDVYAVKYEFDTFEDVIEVGDLIKYTQQPDVENLYEIKDENTRALFTTGLSGEILEIWKRFNNTFVRVCHKENGSWVID